MTKSVLIVYAHPSPNRSRVNRQLSEAARGLECVEQRDLYELYPDQHIDVAVEQQMLRQAKALVFQFPIYWYSAPALLKEWQDNVLASGFAHGEGERVLDGKDFMLAVTTGGSTGAYAEGEAHGAPLLSYLKPLEQTARFCGMKLKEPFIIQGVGSMTEACIQASTETFRERLMALGE